MHDPSCGIRERRKVCTLLSQRLLLRLFVLFVIYDAPLMVHLILDFLELILVRFLTGLSISLEP